jgi:putative spermidine/putrescine transport system ATP-binding protein
MNVSSAEDAHDSGDSRGATVTFRNVIKEFGSFQAVAGFSLSVAAGEFLTLLGPSGSGKTTVLNLLAGFLHPTSGDIFIEDRSIASLPTEKRNIGMVFQNYSLFPHMNVFDNVGFPLRMRHYERRHIRERVEWALDLVQLTDRAGNMPHHLSGGQRQRIAFARAIVFEPKVLLMDEPLGALDLKLREQMQIEIKRYQQQIGCTVIYVTHDQGEALTLSDRIVIMNRGRAVQVGDPEEIYDRPNTRFTANFIGEANILNLERADEGWRIRDIGVPLPQSLAPTGLATRTKYLSVRPEKVLRLSRNANRRSEMVVLDGRVTDAMFVGDAIRYLVEVAAGQSISMKEARTTAAAPLKAGQKIRLGFHAHDAVVVEDPEEMSDTSSLG